MQCSEFEVRLCDYQDGAADAAVRRALQEHAATCSACAALLADAKAFADFLERVPAVEAPPELVTNILYQTQMGSPAWRAVSSGWHARLQSLLQPRFAMGMAMTILSFSMLYRLTDLPKRQVQAADLNPVRLWQSADQKARQLWRRGVTIYQNVLLLYQIQSQLPSLTTEEEADRETGQPKKPADAEPPPSEPRSQAGGPAEANL